MVTMIFDIWRISIINKHGCSLLVSPEESNMHTIWIPSRTWGLGGACQIIHPNHQQWWRSSNCMSMHKCVFPCVSDSIALSLSAHARELEAAAWHSPTMEATLNDANKMPIISLSLYGTTCQSLLHLLLQQGHEDSLPAILYPNHPRHVFIS